MSASRETNYSLSRFYLHFVKGDKRESDAVSKNKFRKNKKSKLNNNYDRLFFNFLLLVKMDSLTLDYNKNTELKFKYEFAQLMENMKFKKMEHVVNNLCYEDNINLKTLSALCCLFSKSMIYSAQNIFAILHEEQVNEPLYLVKQDLSIVCVKEEKFKQLQESSFSIQNLDKPFYSMTHYKLDELKEIALKIGVDTEGRKKDIYSKISQHLSNAIF